MGLKIGPTSVIMRGPLRLNMDLMCFKTLAIISPNPLIKFTPPPAPPTDNRPDIPQQDNQDG